MNCNTTHYRANSSSVPGDPTFHEHYGTLVKGRAYSYQRVEGSWRHVALSFSNTGATSLFTTVEDLALWEHNFAQARVGGPAAVQAMLRTGRLNNGRELSYASGMVVGKRRGLPVVEHSGSDAAFRAHLLRHPEQKLAVIVLANAADLNATRLAREVADLYLEGTPGLQAAGSANPPEIETDARELSPYVGEFLMVPGFFLKFSVQGNRLVVQATGQQSFPLSAAAPGRFFMRAVEASVEFDPPTGGAVQAATWKQGGRETQIKRVLRQPASTEQMTPCLGSFFSDELRVTYRLDAAEGKLWMAYPRGRLELQPVHGDTFHGAHPLGTVSFQRDAAGTCDAFTASNGRVRNLKFRRVALGD